MREVWEEVEAAPSRNLYHYTSIDSVVGIASTRRIWASSAYYLNDAAEIVDAVKLTAAVAKSRARDAIGEEAELLNQLSEWILNLKSPHGVFVFSLTALKNDLGQWRAYTKFGKGVSLTFTPRRLHRVAKLNSLRIARCIYERGAKQKFAASLVERTLESFRNLGYIPPDGCHFPTRYHAFLEQFQSSYFYALATMKNESFRHEREWRLISCYLPRFDEAEYRVGSSMLVPYLPISLEGEDYLVDEVQIGPTEHNNLSMNAMSAFMSKHKVANSCFNCGIPYREWRP